MAVAVAVPPLEAKGITSQLLSNWYASLRAPASTVAPPATSGSAGVAGQIAFDDDFFYVCIRTNTAIQAALWKRLALTAF